MGKNGVMYTFLERETSVYDTINKFTFVGNSKQQLHHIYNRVIVGKSSKLLRKGHNIETILKFKMVAICGTWCIYKSRVYDYA